MTEISIAFLAGIAFGWFFLAPMAAEASQRRQIRRPKAAMDAPRPMTPEERMAALEPEIRRHEKEAS